jgi:hypothetical protein
MPLSFDLFAASDDAEKSRYQILAALAEAREDFRQTRLYPPLGDLVRVHRALRDLDSRRGELLAGERGALTGIDLEEGRLLYEASERRPLPFEELIVWAMPRLEALIEEGRALYDFVEEHAELAPVGLAPTYQDEGFLLVPEAGGFAALRYTVSLFTRAGERYRSIRTAPPTHVEAATAAEARRGLFGAVDWPNPATYAIETDLDFPFEATVLPVAKRKLLHYLASGGTVGLA